MTKKVHVTISDSLLLEVEEQFHRLHQQLLKMKVSGARSKRKKFTLTMVREVAMSLGLEKLKELDYLQFEECYKGTK